MLSDDSQCWDRPWILQHPQRHETSSQAMAGRVGCCKRMLQENVLRSAHAADPAIATVFVQIPRTKMGFAHRSDAMNRPGSRELRAVKIQASCDT